MQRTRNKERGIPNESHPVATNGNPLKRVEANEADTDTDTEYDTDTGYEYEPDNENDIDDDFENEKREPSTKLKMTSPSSKNRIHKDFEVIDLMCQAISEEDSEFFYSEDLSERFYKINEERGWLDGSGEPIVDLVKWYKQFYFTEFPNGYTPEDLILRGVFDGVYDV